MSAVKSKIATELAYWKARPSEEQLSASTEAILHQTLSARKASRFQLPEWAKAWIALIPALFFLVLFMIYPIINTFLISWIVNFKFMAGSNSSFALTNYFAALNNTRGSIKPYWGIDNYVSVLTSQEFLSALGNTAIIVVVSVPLTIIIGLLIAVFLNSIKPLKGFFQTVFFLPYVTNTIALGMVFKVIFSSYSGGLFNQFLGLFGIAPQAWLSANASKAAMLVPIIVYAIWNGLAFKILVFESGLASIDNQYYDAAKIDGASRGTIFARITVPLLSPQILYITITSFIGAFKSYTQVIALFGGGAYYFGGTTQKYWETVVGYIYSTMQDSTKTGVAAAASFVLLIIILLITLVQMQVSKRKVVY